MREVPLGVVWARKNPGAVALVDDVDYARVVEHRWCAYQDRSGTWYAVSKVGEKAVKMHRFILGLLDSRSIVDHENHNGLDNRRCNIRVVSHRFNQLQRRKVANKSSRFKGVCWAKKEQRWRALFCFDGRQRTLGYFKDESEAAHAYDEKAIDQLGALAFVGDVLNFKQEAVRVSV